MGYLVILHEAPYGGERTYNGLRLASTLSDRDGVDIKVDG
jgi:sulfur relay (sulfurtransferase) complex TusBCD TusD component (DsrE family)